MKLVSEQSAKDLARKRALEDVEDALRRLTANLLRVTRGAGKPYDVAGDAQFLINAMVEYREAAGVFPSSHEIAAAITLEQDGDWQCTDERIEAERMIVRGALQMVASQLVGQKLHETAGRTDLHAGVRRLNDISTARAAAARAQLRASVKPRSKKKRPPLIF